MNYKEKVKIIRCKNCIHYIPANKVNEVFKYRNLCNSLNCDGYCENIDKWVDDDFFCADGCETGGE